MEDQRPYKKNENKKEEKQPQRQGGVSKRSGVRGICRKRWGRVSKDVKSASPVKNVKWNPDGHRLIYVRACRQGEVWGGRVCRAARSHKKPPESPRHPHSFNFPNLQRQKRRSKNPTTTKTLLDSIGCQFLCAEGVRK